MCPVTPAERAALPVLTCRTPHCPQARTVVLDGPTSTALDGSPALAVLWWCASCGALWRSVARQTVWEPHDAD